MFFPQTSSAEVEDLFLNSDVHLAEGCRLPSDFDPVPRPASSGAADRQAAYVRLAQGTRGTSGPVGLVIERGGLPDGDADEDAEEDEKLRLGLPSSRDQAELVRRLAPVAGVVALVALLAFAVTQLMSRGKGRDTGAVAVVDTGKEGASRSRGSNRSRRRHRAMRPSPIRPRR